MEIGDRIICINNFLDFVLYKVYIINDRSWSLKIKHIIGLKEFEWVISGYEVDGDYGQPVIIDIKEINKYFVTEKGYRKLKLEKLNSYESR